MTGKTITVSLKVPASLANELPAPGNGRSRFILAAIAEKAARRRQAKWDATTARGRKLAALLAKGREERMPLLTEREVEQELAERRGRQL